jgi:asparagine synthase (glutamine-hydrolysing)
MCGIAGIFGNGPKRAALDAMAASQRHRGPDAEGTYESSDGLAALARNRLSIIDLSPAGRQPLWGGDGRFWLVFNGEIYNYLELRAELSGYPFRTRTDTEVVIAAYERWGAACLDRFVGMFAFLLWDVHTRTLFAARDRFGVKPLHYHVASDGTLLVASEIKALHAAGVRKEPDPVAWATYLVHGYHDHSERTFWTGVSTVPAGCALTWKDGQVSVSRWYDIAERSGAAFDERPVEAVAEEYEALLQQSVRFRFRADVRAGINLSGGLDSSTLLAMVQTVQGPESDVTAFTFVTGDPVYDELPWVRQMLERTHHPLVACELPAADVPALAQSVQAFQDEPFGGLPTLAYARLFERARAEGVIVLLDGQGMDEQWAGYDYYRAAVAENVSQGFSAAPPPPLIQGTTRSATRPNCLTPEFRALAEPFDPPRPFSDALRNLQYRDTCCSKIPRALRFNDRVSMRASTELREPFLDHRLFELALRQPADRKIAADGTGKRLLRDIVGRRLPGAVVNAPKRPLQTPQREWLRGPLRVWTRDRVDAALGRFAATWLDADAVARTVRRYFDEGGDNSFHVWQWINLGLVAEVVLDAPGRGADRAVNAAL